MNEIRDMEKQIVAGMNEAARQHIVNTMVNAHEARQISNECIQSELTAQQPYTVEQLSKIDSTAAITQLRYLRGHISELGERVLHFRNVPIDHACDVNEARANLTLAYRHLEDARMRLGKAIQALDGGVSCYDK